MGRKSPRKRKFDGEIAICCDNISKTAVLLYFRTIENGTETVEEYENDRLIKRIVDGTQLQLTE